MNLIAIQYAIEVERCGSITRAANNLYVTQSTVSRAIKGLEDDIGIELFKRSNTGVVSTHQGREFFKMSKKLIEQYRQLEESYYDSRKPNILNLSVACVRYAVVQIALINVYNRWHAAHEYQNICAVEVDINRVIDHVYDGVYTIGVLLISSDRREYVQNRLNMENIASQFIHMQKAHVQVGKNHPLAHKTSIQMEDLREFPHVTTVDDDILPIHFCSVVKNYDFRSVKKRIVLSDRAFVYDVLQSTEAYYIGMDMRNLPIGKTIKYIPLADTDITLDCVVIYLESHTLTPLELEFIEELRKAAALSGEQAF